MWGVAQLHYTQENAISRGIVSLHTAGWVHLITYPMGGEDLIMMTFPERDVRSIEWIEVHLSAFEQEGLKGAKTLLDKYKHALYPAEAGGAPPQEASAQA